VAQSGVKLAPAGISLRELVDQYCGGILPAKLTQQQFFAAHIQPWVNQLCDAIQKHPKANFYAALSERTRAFVNVEAQGFDMLA
jgi:TorA maturation chaperone TorD